MEDVDRTFSLLYVIVLIVPDGCHEGWYLGNYRYQVYERERDTQYGRQGSDLEAPKVRCSTEHG